MKITVKNQQTLFDIAMQYMGDASYAMDIAVHNDIVLTDAPAPGTELDLPDVELSSAEIKVAKNFITKKIDPAGELPA